VQQGVEQIFHLPAIPRLLSEVADGLDRRQVMPWKGLLKEGLERGRMYRLEQNAYAPPAELVPKVLELAWIDYEESFSY